MVTDDSEHYLVFNERVYGTAATELYDQTTNFPRVTEIKETSYADPLADWREINHPIKQPSFATTTESGFHLIPPVL